MSVIINSETGINKLQDFAIIESPTFTGTVVGVTKTMVGLSNVDNTTDINKPVSSATQTALNLKLSKDSDTGAATLPSGTTDQRKASPVNGDIRFNSTLRAPEFYLNSFWFTADPSQIPLSPIEGNGKTLFAAGERTSDSTWTVPAGVYWIFVKMWGAGGGGGAYGGWRQGSNGGGGGYTQGLVPVVPGEVITYRVGQRGYSRWGANKAYPDGGGASTGGGDNQYTGSAGGSTSIKVPSISSAYCMFAGGGGGGGSVNGYAFNSGGAGGGIQGQPGAKTSYTGGGGTNFGGGGTQTAGGRAGTSDNTSGGAGSFNQGGTHQNSNNYGGGGGGGYYGGGSGAYGGGNSMGGGGGGSGYIHPNIVCALTATGSGNIPANHSDPYLTRWGGQDDLQYARGGEEDGIGGPGLLIIWY
jgi:hypothetical protein